MKALATFDGADVISKEVFDGKVDFLDELIEKRKLVNPKLTFEVFDDDTLTQFDELVIAQHKSPNQSEWELTKGQGTSQAFAFLGKYLGLE